MNVTVRTCSALTVVLIEVAEAGAVDRQRRGARVGTIAPIRLTIVIARYDASVAAQPVVPSPRRSSTLPGWSV